MVDDDAAILREWADGVRHRWPTVGLAVGLVRPGGVSAFRAHGVADIATRRPVSEHTVVRIASITKTFTAIAVMQLVEEGRIDLDAPVGAYLRSFQLVPVRPGLRQPTVRELLTHTAGLPEVLRPRFALSPDFGESVPAGRPVPSLARFYADGLPVVAEPGTRFVYGNHAPATLGQVVADVRRTPLADVVGERVFTPLAMADSDLRRSERLAARLATGYEIRSRGVARVADREMVTTGAAAVYSTPGDMGRYLAALLQGGTGAAGAVLQRGTLTAMFAPQYQPEPRLPGMGLGFFRSDVGGHAVVGHQGTHPGFHSHVAVSPDAGIGVMAFTNGARRADFWLPAETTDLLRRVLGLPDETIRDDVPHRPEIWSDLCGSYRLSARFSDVRLRGMIGAGARVVVRDGRPVLRFMTPVPELLRGLPLHPDDPDDPWVFRLDLRESGMGTMRVVFGRDPSGAAGRLSLDAMPITLHRRPSRRPR